MQPKTTTKKGAPIGNTRAQKGDQPKEGQLQIRCAMTEKTTWVKAAHAKNMNLSQWVISVLNQAADL